MSDEINQECVFYSKKENETLDTGSNTTGAYKTANCMDAIVVGDITFVFPSLPFPFPFSTKSTHRTFYGVVAIIMIIIIGAPSQ